MFKGTDALNGAQNGGSFMGYIWNNLSSSSCEQRQRDYQKYYQQHQQKWGPQSNGNGNNNNNNNNNNNSNNGNKLKSG